MPLPAAAAAVATTTTTFSFALLTPRRGGEREGALRLLPQCQQRGAGCCASPLFGVGGINNAACPAQANE